MKTKLALVTISAAALIASADCQAMMRRAPARMATPKVQKSPVRASSAPKMPRVQAHGTPHITRAIVDVKVRQKANDARVVSYANDFADQLELARKDVKYAQKEMVFGAMTVTGLMLLPYVTELLHEPDNFRAVTRVVPFLVVPGVAIASRIAFLGMNDEAKAKEQVRTAEQALNAFVKKQKAEENFKPHC